MTLLEFNFHENMNQRSRAVKGVGLKLPCVSFAGSNPVAGIEYMKNKAFVAQWQSAD